MADNGEKAICILDFSDEDLTIATKVLEKIAKLHPNVQDRHTALKRSRDRVDLEQTIESVSHPFVKPLHEEVMQIYKDPRLRPLRKALVDAYQVHTLMQYQGIPLEDLNKQKTEERTLKRQKAQEREQQKRYIASTELRRGRIEKLESLNKESAKDEELMKLTQFMIPDGHVDTTTTMHQPEQYLCLKDSVEANGAKAEENDEATSETSGPTLPFLRSCYVCKVRFRDLHRFYDQLCPECAEFNFHKRHQSVFMSGKVAVVTGSRVKIGYQVCLKLLRAGATVIGTTRFPNSAVSSFRTEKDFDLWKDQLQIYGLDLRDVVGLEAFTQYLKLKFGHIGIDIIINNACQTVRRPTAYYKPLVEREESLWHERDDEHTKILLGCMEFERIRRQLVVPHSTSLVMDKDEKALPILPSNRDELHSSHQQVSLNNAIIPSSSHSHDIATQHDKIHNDTSFETTGIAYSAVMTQIRLLPDDIGLNSSYLPPGLSDINGQQLDLRTTNSWILKMSEISTPEIMECFFINALAPFVLNSRLKSLMTTPNTETRPDRYIINVSAMEGKFYRYKTANHPHTNMAKAALNMLTRTSSEDLARNDRIFMNSVDTGWINDENPLDRASKTAKTNLFQTPIDEIDAAARILDPIFTGVEIDLKRNKDFKQYGKFYKDYRETEW